MATALSYDQGTPKNREHNVENRPYIHTYTHTHLLNLRRPKRQGSGFGAWKASSLSGLAFKGFKLSKLGFLPKP